MDGSGARVLAKLIVVILAIGCCGGGLLAMRQSRLQTAHELAAARWRIERQREDLSRLRARISERTTPEAVRAMVHAKPELEKHLAKASDRRGKLGPAVRDDLQAAERTAQ